MLHNKRIPLDYSLISNVYVNLPAVNRRVDSLLAHKKPGTKETQAAWLVRAITCIDLTTLSGDDTDVNVSRLCYKATHPLKDEVVKNLGFKNITTAAVCVYPARVKDAVRALGTLNSDLPVASVATGFPSGQYDLATRISEIKKAIQDGATEIDIVINRTLMLNHQYEELYDELCQMKDACGDVHMKAILAIGELGSLSNVYKASMIAMMAGSDFIKTSTGKEAVNANLVVGIVMCRAIREYYNKTGSRVGLKPAGGLRTFTDALNWLVLVKEELGDEWLNSEMFRIGASSLLTDIEIRLHTLTTGKKLPSYCFPIA